jgi:hypothetical protein
VRPGGWVGGGKGALWGAAGKAVFVFSTGLVKRDVSLCRSGAGEDPQNWSLRIRISGWDLGGQWAMGQREQSKAAPRARPLLRSKHSPGLG